MTGHDVRAFVNRDWARLAEAKAVAWNTGKRTPAEDLRTADGLRRHAQAVRPEWPGPDDRADDLRNHLRISEALGAVAIRPR